MLIDLSPLRHKNFRNLFLGQLISAFGTQMTAVVIPFQVYSLTHSALYTGLVSGVEFIFLFFSSLLGGALADRFEKRTILLWVELFLSIVPLGLALNSWNDHPQLWVIFVLAAITSALGGLHRPALESLTPRLVNPEEIAKVSALSPMRHILTTILSPMIGGLTIEYLGPTTTYLFDSLTFFISLCFLLAIDYRGMAGNKTRQKWHAIFGEISEGFQYILKRREILGSYVSDFIVMVLCNPVALYPALAAAFHKESSIGMLYAFPSVGAFIMTVLSRWTLSRKRYGVFIIGAGGLWSLSMVFVGMAPSFTLILAGLFSAGFFDMISGIFRTRLWNETIPESIRGRIAGFEMLSYMSGPLLGNAILGFFADLVGIQLALFSGALLSLLLMVLFNWIVPNLWHFTRLEKSS